VIESISWTTGKSNTEFGTWVGLDRGFHGFGYVCGELINHGLTRDTHQMF